MKTVEPTCLHLLILNRFFSCIHFSDVCVQLLVILLPLLWFVSISHFNEKSVLNQGCSNSQIF